MALAWHGSENDTKRLFISKGAWLAHHTCQWLAFSGGRGSGGGVGWSGVNSQAFPALFLGRQTSIVQGKLYESSDCMPAQLCLTLCDSMDCSPPGSSVFGISHARILEWVAIASSRGSSWPRDRTPVFYGSWIDRQIFTTESAGKPPLIKCLRVCMCVYAQSHMTLCDPWTVGHQAPLFMGFPRQEDRSRLPLSTPRGLFNQGSNPRF